VQFHPEVTHTRQGGRILSRFILEICGCEALWTPSNIVEDAIAQGVARADKTLRHVEGAWIQEQKVIVRDGAIAEYRVNMKVTFILAD